MIDLENKITPSTGADDPKNIVTSCYWLQNRFDFLIPNYYNYTNQNELAPIEDNLSLKLSYFNDESNDEKGQDFFLEKKDFCQNSDNEGKEENQPVFLGRLGSQFQNPSSMLYIGSLYDKYTNQNELATEEEILGLKQSHKIEASNVEKKEDNLSEKKDFCQNLDNKVKEENQPFFLGKKTKEKKKIFEINKNKEKYIYRFDYYLKAFKTNFISYSLRLLNETYEEFLSKFGENELKQKKFHLSNYKKVQGNTKESDNREFVKKTFKDILIDYNKEDNNGTRNQKENENLINSIYNTKGFPSDEEQKNLKNLLEMKIEDLLDKYYEESEEFEKFSLNKTIISWDKDFYRERNRHFSLLQKKEGNYKCGFVFLTEGPPYSRTGKNKECLLIKE